MSTLPLRSTQTQPPDCARSRWTVADLVWRAGDAYRRAGSSKAIASAHRMAAVSSGTRLRQGVAWAPLTKALEPLASHPTTNPFPALTEAWVLVIQPNFRNKTPAWLLARRAELEALEFDLHRDIQHARPRGEGLRQLRAQQADMALELTAIETEIDERRERGEWNP